MKRSDLKKYMHDYHKQHYELAKKEKRCVKCGWQDQRTKKGYTRCERCADFAKKIYRSKRSLLVD